jgi:hypothetical protein
MLTTKRLLLGILMLGVVGMHGLAAVEGAPAGHHGTPVVVASPLTAGEPPTHAAASSHTAPPHAVPDDEGAAGALALCLALLLALAGAVAAGRSTTWVRLLGRGSPRLMLPLPPVLRARSPVPRFTVMRC